MGYEAALALAVAGADVVIADRNDAQAQWAVGKIRSIAPAALVRFEKVDLADIESISALAERLKTVSYTHLPKTPKPHAIEW